MSVATPHRAYTQALLGWEALRDAYAGARAVKGRGALAPAVRGNTLTATRYLPRPAGLTQDAQYEAYKARAVFLGATERVVHGVTGAIFRREPTIEAPALLTPQLEDVTQTGVPLRTFAEQIVRETLLMGRCGILVDFPQGEPLPDSRVQPPPGLSRPYWVTYPTETIVNWRTMQRQGDTVLSLVVLRECVPVPQGPWGTDEFFVAEEQTQYRVLRLDERGRYEVSLWVEVPGPAPQTGPLLVRTQTWVPLRLGEPLDFIPFVFLAPFSLEPAVEKSLLDALVEINYQYYRHSADYEHALHMTALPTAYICSSLMEVQSEMVIGGSFAWIIPDSTATVGMLEFHGQGLQSHEHAMEADLKNMAALGGRLLEGRPLVEETATAVMARTQGTDSPVQSLVTTVSHGLTQALQLHAWWDGRTEDVDDTSIHMTLNSDLIAQPLDAQMLIALMQMVLNDTMTYETFYFNLERGEITRPMISVDEERALLEIRKEAQPLAPPRTPPPRNGTTPVAA
jgi:hypothetical protein